MVAPAKPPSSSVWRRAAIAALWLALSGGLDAARGVAPQEVAPASEAGTATCGATAEERALGGGVSPAAALEEAADAAGEDALPPAPHAIRVDRASFWYEAAAACAAAARWGGACAPKGTSQRVAVLLASEVADHAIDFPQPPPFDVVVRAQPRVDLERGLSAMTTSLSYALTERRGDVVVIELSLSPFVGAPPLNDAELRSLLGHELVHVYQVAHGVDGSTGPALWRREIEAHEWELVHMDLGVRSWYRAEALFNLDMYRRMLAEE